MKILLVEDDSYKEGRIKVALASVASLDIATDVASVTNIWDAARAVKDHRPDILILDVALPLRENGHPTEYAGIEFLEEILRHPEEYGSPKHVIGITAYPEIQERCSREFASWLLTLVLYRPDHSDWEEALVARIDQLLRADAVPQQYSSDLAIVCALESPELSAVLKLPWSWVRTSVPGDHTTYHQGRFVSRNGERKVVAAFAARKGMPATICVAAKMIHAFRPRFLAMVGIAAGIRGRVQAGDIMIANPCWDWGSGKWRRDGDAEGHFDAAPFQAQLDPALREQFRGLATDLAMLDGLRREWPGETPPTVLSARVGPVASGAAVLADQSMLAMISDQHRELIGVEMEAYGIFVVADESAEPRPRAMVIKSVVDFGDSAKDDRFQAYGAYTSAGFLRLFAEQHL